MHYSMGNNVLPVLETEKFCPFSQVYLLWNCFSGSIDSPFSTKFSNFSFSSFHMPFSFQFGWFLWLWVNRWQITYPIGADAGYKLLGMEWGSLQSPIELIRKWGTDNTKEKEMFQRNEWFGRLMRFRNDALVILSIICLQLPFEVAYAHTYEIMESDLMK